MNDAGADERAPATLVELIRRSVDDVVGGRLDVGAAFARAVGYLERLEREGRLDACAVRGAAEVVSADVAPIAAPNLATGIVLGGARRTGDVDTLCVAAVVHVSGIRRVLDAPEFRAAAGPDAIDALASDALRVAVEVDLGESHPDLVGGLHRHRARARDRRDPPDLAGAIEDLDRALVLADRESDRESDRDGAARSSGTRAPTAPSIDEELIHLASRITEVDRSTWTVAVPAALAVLDRLAPDAADALRRMWFVHLLELHALDDAEAVAVELRHRPPTPDLQVRFADLAAQQGRFEEALAIVDGIENGIDDGVIDDTEVDRDLIAAIRVNALLRLDRSDEALVHSERRIAVLDDVLDDAADTAERRHRASHAHVQRALALAALDRLEEAEAGFEEVRARFDRTGATDDMRLDLPLLAAQALWRDEPTTRARRWIEEAADERDAQSVASSSVHLTARIRGPRAELDVRRARLAGRDGHARAALLAGEAGKAQSTRRITESADRSTSIADRAVLASLRTALRNATRAAHTAARDLELLPGTDADRAAAARHLHRRRVRVHDLQRQLDDRAATRIVRPRPPVDLGERLDTLVRSGIGVVSMTIGDDGTTLAGVGPSSEAVVVLDSPTLVDVSRDLLAPLRWERSRITSAARLAVWDRTLTAMLRGTHDRFGEPIRRIAERIGGDRIVLIPHRDLHELPFPSAFGSDGRTLTDDLGPISVLPALALHDPGRSASPDRGLGHRAPTVAVGCPDRRAPLLGLEAAAVAERAERSVRLTGDAATPDAVADAVHGAAVVHLAVHGSYTPWQPDRTGLQLAAPPDRVGAFGTGEGFVTAAAMSATWSLRDARLVVLSACETGLADPTATDDHLGLASIALAMGARWVVASLWAVDDLTTLALIDRVHRMLPGRDVPAALADASAWVRHTPRRAIADELSPLTDLAADVGAADEFRASLDRFVSVDAPVGPDGWASFCAYGAPTTEEEPWPDDG